MACATAIPTWENGSATTTSVAAWKTGWISAAVAATRFCSRAAATAPTSAAIGPVPAIAPAAVIVPALAIALLAAIGPVRAIAPAAVIVPVSAIALLAVIAAIGLVPAIAPATGPLPALAPAAAGVAAMHSVMSVQVG